MNSLEHFGARERVRRALAMLSQRCRVIVDTAALRARGLQPDDRFDLRCANMLQFQQYVSAHQQLLLSRTEFEDSLIPPCDYFSVQGYCEVCQRLTDFRVDFQYAYAERLSDGRPRPNWRERLVCPRCKLPNRQRALIDFFATSIALDRNARLYAPEKRTPFFRALRRVYRHAIGSELLRDGTPFGRQNTAGVRNEDLTRLTFSDESLHGMCVADVLEHVPQYRDALSECRRCLRKGAPIVISVPFLLDAHDTLVRARINRNGRVEHLLPPEYHGDPLDERGVLCYYHFGWDLLETLTELGFSDPVLCFYWSAERSYLGGMQFLITARRSLR